MAVRNPLKAGADPRLFPQRKHFLGDLAAAWKPDDNPEPTTLRGLRRGENGKKQRSRAATELLVGLAKRPHVSYSGKDNSIPGTTRVNGHHTAHDSYTRFVSLIHGRRVYR